MTVGTEGETGLDISKLRSETGAVTLDYGYANTGSCESAITFIDGEKGILRYRGIPIEQLAESSSFLEVSYLLFYGELPTSEQLADYTQNITMHTLLHEDLRHLFTAFPTNAHPMAVLSSAVNALATYYPDHHHMGLEGSEAAMFRLMGKVPTIAAAAYKHGIGQPFTYPNNALSYTENFLNMMFAVPSEAYPVHPDVAKALDVLLILHADHEQNCSTSTVRLVGSSQANLYASVAAGINALWGPLHGGANQAVLEMLEAIRTSGDSVDSFIKEVKDKDSTSRLMGFGHRVYKNFDPRAKIIKNYADKVLAQLHVSDPLLDIAKELEEHALKDDYFVARKLYPNVDFYSGIIYDKMGIGVDLFTPLFAMSRVSGWLAHWLEQLRENKLFRPDQIYSGEHNRPYVPIAQR